MAAGQADFTQLQTFPQPEAPGPGARPRPPGAVAAAAAGTPDARQQMTGFAGGAGKGRPDRDRRRYAWLYDDEDIWGADGVSVPPAVWGGDWRAPRV